MNINTRVSHNTVTAVSRRGAALRSGGLPGWQVGLSQERTDVRAVCTRGRTPVSAPMGSSVWEIGTGLPRLV